MNSAFTVKKLLITGALLGSAILPMYAQAAVTLLVDDNIKVTAINGQEIKQSAFKPLTKQFTLQPGKHVITAKYDRLFDFRNDDHDYLRSGNISVAAELQDNQTYTLVMPGQPEGYQEAKKYADNPTLAVQQGNSVIASQKSTAGSNGGIFSGLTKAVGGIFGGSGDAQMANQRAIASLEKTGTVNGSAAIPAIQTSNTQVVTPASNASTLDQFMQLWLKATPEERAKIRQWIQE